MTISDTQLEKVLMDLLQKNLKFSINNKQFKKGKFILFKQNNYVIELTINKDSIQKKFDMPIPFNIEYWKDDGVVYFDYRLTALSRSDSFIYNILVNLPRVGNNKFFNKIVEIEVL